MKTTREQRESIREWLSAEGKRAASEVVIDLCDDVDELEKVVEEAVRGLLNQFPERDRDYILKDALAKLEAKREPDRDEILRQEQINRGIRFGEMMYAKKEPDK